MSAHRLASGVGILPALLVILMPKCPLCLVPYLSLLGLGSGMVAAADSLAPWVPLARALGWLTLVVLTVVLVVGRYGSRTTSTRCCSPARPRRATPPEPETPVLARRWL